MRHREEGMHFFQFVYLEVLRDGCSVVTILEHTPPASKKSAGGGRVVVFPELRNLSSDWRGVVPGQNAELILNQ